MQFFCDTWAFNAPCSIIVIYMIYGFLLLPKQAFTKDRLIYWKWTCVFFRPENLYWHSQSNGCRFEVSLGKKPMFDWLHNCNKIFRKQFFYQNLNCDHSRFFRSANNVILSPGDSSGVIQTDFFAKVKNVKKNQIIFSAGNQV